MTERDEFISRICAALEVPEHLVREMIEAERPAREEAEAEMARLRALMLKRADEISQRLNEELRR